MTDKTAKVLIVEDEVRIASFIEKGLQKHGFKTVSVGNGLDAIDTLQRESFDIVLLDLGLPKKDGLAVLKEVRQNDVKLPIIIVTAREGESNRHESMKLGATDYLPKPFRFKELLNKIHQHLDCRA